jgi:hypothetical protein
MRLCIVYVFPLQPKCQLQSKREKITETHTHTHTHTNKQKTKNKTQNKKESCHLENNTYSVSATEQTVMAYDNSNNIWILIS